MPLALAVSELCEAEGGRGAEGAATWEGVEAVSGAVGSGVVDTGTDEAAREGAEEAEWVPRRAARLVRLALPAAGDMRRADQQAGRQAGRQAVSQSAGYTHRRANRAVGEQDGRAASD